MGKRAGAEIDESPISSSQHATDFLHHRYIYARRARIFCRIVGQVGCWYGSAISRSVLNRADRTRALNGDDDYPTFDQCGFSFDLASNNYSTEEFRIARDDGPDGTDSNGEEFAVSITLNPSDDAREINGADCSLIDIW